ncbi:MAG: hypothetical protein NTZ64_05785 [Polaromonas sp.]|nr:hypothetical protein [Polaromonas sp.]
MAKSQDEIFNKVLHLTCWPPLEQLLLETAQPVTRICALLARRPSVGMFIPVILDMPPEIIYPLLQMLYEKGHIRQESIFPANSDSLDGDFSVKDSGRFQTSPAVMLHEEMETARPARSPVPTETLSFFELLWRRLTDGNKPGEPNFV